MHKDKIIKYTDINIKQGHKILDIIKKQTSNKMAFVKFILMFGRTKSCPHCLKCMAASGLDFVVNR